MQALPLARPRAQQQTQARAHTQAQAQARTLEELRGVGIVASATTAPHQPAVQSTADSSIARPSVIGSSIAGSLSANAPSTSSSQSQSQSSSQSEPQPMPIRKPLGPRHTYPWKSTNDLAQANPIQRPVSMEAAPKPAETPKVHPPESVISAATPAPTAHIQDTSANTASSSDPSLLPEVDIVIHNLHADSRGTSRAVRRLPVAVLLAHMMGIIARRGLLLHSVAATVHSITIVLEDGSIGRRKFGRNSGFSTFVGELVNLPKEVWPGSGGTGSGERNEHIRPEEEADKSDDEEGLLGEVHDLEEKT
ncbi:hypothetical protein SBRCBS47491_001960 [Sporothrix bragantina]|uniref:Uncharacterized protein n=1 Tax=Sporothrix bragantina TaxID=671064 RepID=A0ABP0B2Z5_9PEZI